MNMAKRFQNKDSMYSGADYENIMDLILQHDFVSRDSYLSHNEKHLFVLNLFCGKALRYYYAAIEPLGNNYANVITRMQSQFIRPANSSVRKLSYPSYHSKTWLKSLMATEERHCVT